MILNLTGPPGVGKSSVSNLMLSEYSDFDISYHNIVNYKKRTDDLDIAWYYLVESIINNKNKDNIVESCGTDWRLKWISSITDNICTIFLHGNIKTISKRIKKRNNNIELSNNEIEEAMFTLINIDKQTIEPNFIINIDNMKIEEVHSVIKEKIALFKQNKETQCKY